MNCISKAPEATKASEEATKAWEEATKVGGGNEGASEEATKASEEATKASEEATKASEEATNALNAGSLIVVARFKMMLEYAGTRYSGWQKQKNARTVQGDLERAIAEALDSDDFEFQGAGRTDAGVHALMQVAHLEAHVRMPLATLRRRINEELPPDINVLSLAKAHHRFHARHAAVARSYLYQVARRRTAFAKPYVWWVKEPLDCAAMQQAAAQFAGMHDFRSFSDDDPEEKSTAVLVDEVIVGEHGDLVLIRVIGSHFLWKMVRRMVGVIVAIGRGELPASSIEDFLRHPSGTPARLTAPGSGLFLERVLYDGDERHWPLTAAIPVPLSSGEKP